MWISISLVPGVGEMQLTISVSVPSIVPRSVALADRPTGEGQFGPLSVADRVLRQRFAQACNFTVPACVAVGRPVLRAAPGAVGAAVTCAVRRPHRAPRLWL